VEERTAHPPRTGRIYPDHWTALPDRALSLTRRRDVRQG
jgi:hypothetical protein